MIKFIKNDYKSVTEALGGLVGKKIPLWIGLPYYIILGAIVLPLSPFAWLYCKIQLLRISRELKKL